MSDPDPPTTPKQTSATSPKEIEVDMATLKKMLDDPEDRQSVRNRMNRFDRSLYSARLRETTREVYQRRGENQQQRETMQGFMKARGNVPELGHNLALSMANELGGMYKAAKGLQQKSWWEKNRLGFVLFVTAFGIYATYLFSPVAKQTIDALFEPIQIRIMLAATAIVIFYLWYRQRTRAQP